MGYYYRAYSMEYGTFIGLSWSAMFLCYVYGLCGSSDLLVLLCLVFGVVSLCLPFVLSARMNRIMASDGVRVTYWQGLLFAFSIMMYACLLHGIVVCGYFQLFDHGALYSTLSEMLSTGDAARIYRQMGMSEQYDTVMKLLGDFGSLSALNKAMMMFNSDFTWSVVLAFMMAIPLSWKRRK